MTHTTACRTARAGHYHEAGRNDVTPDWPHMWRLTAEEQQAILECWDEAHDSVRLFLRGKPVAVPLPVA